MKDTDGLGYQYSSEKEKPLSEKLSLPILKKSIIFAMTFGFFWSKHGIFFTVSYDG